MPALLIAVVAGLLAERVAYHGAYIEHSPFAVAPVGESGIHERAALDIYHRFPLGSAPFERAGIYAYALAVSRLAVPVHAVSMLCQLLVATGMLFVFFRAARAAWGRRAAGLSTIVLLADPALAFYENKALPIAMASGCMIALLWAYGRAAPAPSFGRLVTVGACAGLAGLASAWLLLAVPFTVAGASLLAGSGSRRRASAAAALGVVLILAPMAVRNGLVTGMPTVLPSDAGGIALFLGHNPHAEGVPNRGGVLSGVRNRQRSELRAGFGLRYESPKDVDVEIGREAYRRGFGFVGDAPLGWLGLEARKLWYTLGNDWFSELPDRVGEEELLGGRRFYGLPFAFLLAFGVLGLTWLVRRSRSRATEAAHADAWLWLLGGQVVAVLAANLLAYSSAAQRAGLGVPLAFVAGPALVALGARLSGGARDAVLRWPELALAGVLFAQAWIPRGAPEEASGAHYFQLGHAQERTGSLAVATGSYARAIEREPGQPIYLLYQAQLLRMLMAVEPAEAVLDQLDRIDGLSRRMKRAARGERHWLARIRRQRDRARAARANPVPPALPSAAPSHAGPAPDMTPAAHGR